MANRPASSQSLSGSLHKFDVVADAPDSRDRVYNPPLISLRRKLEPWQDSGATWWRGGRVRDQGREGSCVGYAMAAVIDHLRAHAIAEDKEHPEAWTLDAPWVSARMLYETARFHDEWSGENYSGSSLRGGLKGFFYNGVCSMKDEDELGLGPGADSWASTWYMTKHLADKARTIQLGAYYRICPRLPDMHAALNEAGVIVASSYVHDGWVRPGKDGTIAFSNAGVLQSGEALKSMHAFAIVGYNDDGFWIQNSWGPDWGVAGCALWTYADWAATFCDAWVMRLAVLPPKQVGCNAGRLRAYSPFVNRAETHFLGKAQRDFSAPSRLDVLGHMLPFRDGLLDEYGPYNVNQRTLTETFKIIHDREDDDADGRRSPGGPPHWYRHVLIYFLGGWPDESELAAQLAEISLVFREHRVYPLFFVWETALFRELACLVRRTIDEVRQQSLNMSDRRRNARDRLIEERLAIPANRLLRELRCGARRMFVPDRPDPDTCRIAGEAAPGEAPCGFNAARCLNELFAALEDRYRKGTISYHLAAHGFGAQVLLECLVNNDRFDRCPVFATGSLISPLVALDRARQDLFEAVLSDKDGRAGRRRRTDEFMIEQLDLYLLSDLALRLDRFSDEYGGAWPELWTRVLAMGDKDRSRLLEDDGMGQRVLPLLAIGRDALGATQRRGRNVSVFRPQANEDEADSSLHHDLSLNRKILSAMLTRILGAEPGDRQFFGKPSREIIFDERPG